ncbi:MULTISPECIES: hypothetical protein [Arthrobacter]|uniref:Tight adherence protein B n=2 Tax=Arthrobacter TaxID=1663 RepID=A0ABU9KKZ5_9MICC|nr:hypothetical protein [Arthrobacter sp. YJM1]MDP5227575.1 hypothetical protein [Arthrobacter sp. YJM1]
MACLLISALLLLGPGPGHRLRFRLPSSAERLRPAFLPKRPALPARAPGRAAELETMAALVQYLASLLVSGRPAAQAWKELDVFHRSQAMAEGTGPTEEPVLVLLGVASRAAELGGSPAQAIRRALAERAFRAGTSSAMPECWERIALCVRASELSGCPLAALLTRLALDLEHSADAEGARQAALAGPKASVALLAWLPFLGLGLGLLLGVDPVEIIIVSPAGLASVVAGLILWAVGRLWSRALVTAAEGRS